MTSKTSECSRILKTGSARPRATSRTAGTKSGVAAIEFARCFLELANLPNLALDRLSRYEATLWRQTRRTIYALEMLERRKPQERSHRVWQFGMRNSVK